MSDDLVQTIRARVVDVPDFPKPGILFKDLTPVFANPAAFKATLELFSRALEGADAELIVGIEARGFILGAALANELGIGFVPVRKKGKLPRQRLTQDYALEYGTDSLEIHTDSIAPGTRVAIVDDVLATGGTAEAAAALVRRAGGSIVRALFLLELGFLGGRDKLSDVEVFSLL